MRTRFATWPPKPVRMIELLFPTGINCCVFASVNIARMEFETVRTSVCWSSTMVVTSTAGWRA